MKKGIVIVSVLIAAVVLLGGCAAGPARQDAPPPDSMEGVMRNPPELAYPAPAPRTEGSLFSDDAQANMYTDVTAKGLGDIVTINIVETSNATKEAKTSTGRKSALSANVKALMGYETKLGLPKGFDPASAISTDFSSDFSGTGNTSRKESMTAQISARVIKILPNGNLVLRGSREISLNNERQLMVIMGIVRPEDISPSNSIQSTYLADARIDYSGQGDVTRSQRKGWGTQLVDLLWPF
ncbi:MAG: flagellar basal body L-ring protein FlgH [Pseudomonadota bacterium]